MSSDRSTPDAARMSGASETTDAGGEKLLIVEDNSRFADTLATELRDRGYEVETLDSLAAVRQTDASRFRYAIIDLRLRMSIAIPM